MPFKRIIRKSGKLFLFIYNNTEGFLLGVFTVLLVADVLAGILARYVRFEVVFATELGKYLFIWLCAIGISLAAKDNQHVRINFIADKLPINRKITWILSQALFLLFSVFFFYWGLQLTIMHFNLDKSVMGFNFPMYVFTTALPVGFGLTSIRLVHNIINSIKKDNKTPWITESFTTLTDIQNEEEESGD
ncbi:MAG: TRAP transporter small permease subunit [Mariniphaga sp.]|nr:TRAP transporter small permease subunit [Mariniphaga sp.]